MKEYSYTQEMVVHWLGAPTAFVSFCCSLLLLIHISFRQKKLKTYHRFLFGLSLADIASSSTLLVARFLYLKEPSSACSGVGIVLITTISASAFYNVFLAILFLVMIKYGTREQHIEKFFEIPCHVTALFTSLLVALMGHFLEAINPVSFSAECWLSPYPSGCFGDECIRGGTWGFVLDQFSHAVYYLIVLILAVCNIQIYCKVRKTLGRNQRYSFSLNKDRSRNTSVSGSSASWRRTSLSNLSDNTDRKSRQVAIRSFLFCAGFALSYTFSTLITDIERWAKTSPHGTWWFYALMVLDSLLFPLQGFWDSVIYFRPRYIQWRSTCPKKSRFFALRKTVLSLEEPASASQSRASEAARKVRLQTDDPEDDDDIELSYSQEIKRCNNVVAPPVGITSNADELAPCDVSWDEFHHHFAAEE